LDRKRSNNTDYTEKNLWALAPCRCASLREVHQTLLGVIRALIRVIRVILSSLFFPSTSGVAKDAPLYPRKVINHHGDEAMRTIPVR
jgi:hypothetical protein